MKQQLLFVIVLVALLIPGSTMNAMTAKAKMNKDFNNSPLTNSISPLKVRSTNIYPWTALQNITKGAISATLADVDGDKKWELFVTTENSLLLFKAINQTHFRVLFNISASPQFTPPIAADFNGDGKHEIAVALRNGSIVILDGQGSVFLKGFIGKKQVLQMCAFDFNYNGGLDVIFLVNASQAPFVGIVSSREVSGPIRKRGLIEWLGSDIISELPVLGFIIWDYDFGQDPYRTYHIIFPRNNSDMLYAFRKGESLLGMSASGKFKFHSEIVIGNFTANPTLLDFATLYYHGGTLSLVTFDIMSNAIDSASIKFANISNVNKFLPKLIASNFLRLYVDSVAFLAEINDSVYVFLSLNATELFSIPLTKIHLENISTNLIAFDYDNDGKSDLAFGLRNGSILVIHNMVVSETTLNTTENTTNSVITFNYTITNVAGLPNQTLLLVGDVNYDGSSDLISISPQGVKILSFTTSANGSWPMATHDPKNLRTTRINDWDGDGLLDFEEIKYNCSPYDSDLDNDFANDYTEIFILNTSVSNNDTDGDNMPDGWEARYSLNPLNASDATIDVDHDNITNIYEWLNRTSPISNDTDADNLTDWAELFIYNTSPINPDTDGDYMPDGWEIEHNYNPLNASDGALDPDRDGLNNSMEFKYGADPFNPDTDYDGMNDAYEVKHGFNVSDPKDATFDNDSDNLINKMECMLGTDPFNNDTDNDTMPDGWEYYHSLNPLDPSDAGLDLDGDGLNCSEEFKHKTDPTNPDTDGDGIPDGWEVQHNLNPLDANDSFVDPDHDGLSNAEEYKYGTDPWNPDTDNDGLTDGNEVAIGTNPLNPDTDGDGLNDSIEVAIGTNPLNPDTDGDGLNDGVDKYPIDPTNGLGSLIWFILLPISLILAIYFIIRRKK